MPCKFLTPRWIRLEHLTSVECLTGAKEWRHQMAKELVNLPLIYAAEPWVTRDLIVATTGIGVLVQLTKIIWTSWEMSNSGSELSWKLGILPQKMAWNWRILDLTRDLMYSNQTHWQGSIVWTPRKVVKSIPISAYHSPGKWSLMLETSTSRNASTCTGLLALKFGNRNRHVDQRFTRTGCFNGKVLSTWETQEWALLTKATQLRESWEDKMVGKTRKPCSTTGPPECLTIGECMLIWVTTQWLNLLVQSLHKIKPRTRTSIGKLISLVVRRPSRELL